MTHILGLQRKDINMASRFAPDTSMQAQMRYSRAQETRQQAEGAEADRNAEEKQNWQQAVKMAKDIGQTYQSTVNNQIESNLMKYSIPQGKFFVDKASETVAWKWNDNATTKKLPTMEEAWGTYRKAKLLSGQQPLMNDFYPVYNKMNANWAQFMSGKLQALAGGGYDANDLRDALSDKDLLQNIGQVSSAMIASPDGKGTMQAGNLLGPWTQPIIGKSEGTLGKFVGELGLPTLGAAGFGAYKAHGAGLIPGTEKFAAKASERALAKGSKLITKAGTSKFMQKNPVKVMKAITQYVSKHGSDDLVKLLVKRGIGKKAATKIATRAIASAAAAGVGAASGGFTAGLSTVAGVGLAAYGLWDIWGALEEVYPDIEEKLSGGVKPVGF